MVTFIEETLSGEIFCEESFSRIPKSYVKSGVKRVNQAFCRKRQKQSPGGVL